MYMLKRFSPVKEIRKTLKNMYMAGLKNFARICDEMEQMKSYKPLEDGSGVVDPYMIVMNKAHDGYRRPYGRDAELEVMQINIKKQQKNLEPMMWKFAEQPPERR
uniref:Uncharacterized protein n=1 Tax=Lactuca sativa TaxID=4236 RepID=A0A9R1WFH2_LACSA|nr:hypothetical protein LSAT_V11C100028690 [Lactuca sativa]